MSDQLTEEELAKLTPEQLRELQKQQCIFCHIVSGRVASRKIYEDDKCLAVLDINPAAAGHVLLLPKEHYSILPQMPADEIGHLGAIAKHISKAAIQSLKATGTTVFAANGVAAGQRAAHVMLHIIPRTEGDSVGITLPERNITDAQMHKLQQTIIPAVRGAFGLPADALNFDAKPAQKGTTATSEKDDAKKNVGARPEKAPAKTDENEQRETAPHAADMPTKDGPAATKTTTTKPAGESTLDDIANLLLGKKK